MSPQDIEGVFVLPVCVFDDRIQAMVLSLMQ